MLRLVLVLAAFLSLVSLGCGDGGKDKHKNKYWDIPRPAEKPE